ncbi:ABC transporter ATP-binding protein [Nesterenkonia populi]
MKDLTAEAPVRFDHTAGDRLIEDSPLAASGLTLGYDQEVIAEDLSATIPPESFTVIVGPNGCGKSTLLRALARLLKPAAGSVLLQGRDIREYGAKAVSRRIGLLPQSSLAPDGMTVADLVSRGRYPHQGLLRQWTREDARAVSEALAATGLAELSGKRVAELSGGQRQRAWIAVVLAQQTSLLLLDEPTTFLDIAHQIDLMELFTDLHGAGKTLVAVLHDINQAARYATHMIAMKDGQIVAVGPPREIVTVEMVRRVFGVECVVIEDPVAGTPAIIPKGRGTQPRNGSTTV